MTFEKIDSKDIPHDTSEICLFVATRNNESIMPEFFRHYKNLGVDRFFVIDNMSVDGTVKFLLDQENTHVFRTDEPYRIKNQNWNRWANRLKKHTMGNWCVIVDSDEFLIYPYCETHTLKEFTSYLDKEGSTSVRGRLIDMYSSLPVKDAILKKGQNIFKVLSYFDYPCKKKNSPRMRAIKQTKKRKRGRRGRARMRGIRLNKTPLFKCTPNTIIKSGHHSIWHQKASQTVSCGILHFKYTAEYIFHLIIESKRQVYYGKASIKKKMLEVFRKNINFSFFCLKSKKYEDSKQLIDLGIIKMEGEYGH